MSGSLFDGVAAAYAISRPTYPDALYDAIGSALGRPFSVIDVVDVGAGSGIGTAAFVARAPLWSRWTRRAGCSPN
jgi:hypothetical protein